MLQEYPKSSIEKLASIIIDIEYSDCSKEEKTSKISKYMAYIFTIQKIPITKDILQELSKFNINFKSDISYITVKQILKINPTLQYRDLYLIINNKTNNINLFKIQTDDAIKFLINSVESLIYKTGKKLLPNESNKELYNIGYIGAYDAAIEFNHLHNVKFITFAYKYIYGVFFEYKTLYNSQINYTSSLYNLNSRYEKLINKYKSKNISNIEELVAQELNMDINSINKKIGYFKNTVSLDQTINDDDSETVMESIIPDINSMELFDKLENENNSNIINVILLKIKELRGQNLGDREYEIFIKFAGIFDKPLTIKELSKEYKITVEAIQFSIYKSQKILRDIVIEYNNKHKIFNLRKKDIQNTKEFKLKSDRDIFNEKMKNFNKK